MTSFPRNRYDSDEFTRGYDNASLQLDGGTWCISFPITHPDRDEMTIWFPGAEKPNEKSLRSGREICAKIAQLDNVVQNSCENEYQTHKHDVINYDLYLAYIEITDLTASLEYFGTVVNTQWAAMFKRNDSGDWLPENF